MTKRARTGVAVGRTFRSGNSEAVRLPKDVAYDREVELTIVRSGEVVTMFPAHAPIGELVARLAKLPRPRRVEKRDKEMPERRGL